MPQQFWIEEYRKKAALPNPVAQSGRGNQFEAVEFLYVVKEVVELLDLRPAHNLLDVGCANGLLDIVLSACCHDVLALEPVKELAELARKNLAHCRNVRIEAGHGADIPSPDGSFDRILMLEVVQLVSPDEIRKVFHELRRVARPGARILLGSVPDARCKDAFLGPYLEGVRTASHLSEGQKSEILARNASAHWYDAADLAAWWRDLGGKAERHPLPAGDPDAGHRFNLVVSLQG